MADNFNPKTLNDTGDAYFFGIGRAVNPSCSSVLLTRPPRLLMPAGALVRPLAAKSWSCVARV